MSIFRSLFKDRTLATIPTDAWVSEDDKGGGLGTKPRLSVSVFNPIELTDSAGRKAQISQGGELITGFRVDDISINFQYGISTNDIKGGGAEIGTGVVGHSGSMAFVETGTGIGSATLESLDAIRYRSGHECYCFPSVVMPVPEPNVNMYMGFFNEVDAYCVGYEGEDFGLWLIGGGVPSFIKQTDWNVDKLNGSGKSGYNINPQTGNIPGHKFTWHGFKDLSLEFDLGNGNQILVHTITSINSAVTPHLKNPNLPVSMRIERLSGTGANLRMSTSSWRAGIISGIEENTSSDRWFAFWNLNVPVTASGGGSWWHIATLRSKDTYLGKSNHIKSVVKLLASNNATNKDILFGATRLSALVASDVSTIEAGFNDLDSLNSVLEGSKDEFVLATTVTESIIGDVAIIPRGDKVRNTDVQGLNIYPSGDIVFIAFVEAPGDVSFQSNTKELH